MTPTCTGGEEAVGVLDEVRQALAAPAALGDDPLHLALAQGDERDLGRGEEAADEREEQHDAEVEQELAHLWIPPRAARAGARRLPARSCASSMR